jgi:hypothetical protein
LRYFLRWVNKLVLYDFNDLRCQSERVRQTLVANLSSKWMEHMSYFGLLTGS